MLINYRIFIDSLLNGKTLKVSPKKMAVLTLCVRGRLVKKNNCACRPLIQLVPGVDGTRAQTPARIEAMQWLKTVKYTYITDEYFPNYNHLTEDKTKTKFNLHSRYKFFY